MAAYLRGAHEALGSPTNATELKGQRGNVLITSLSSDKFTELAAAVNRWCPIFPLFLESSLRTEPLSAPYDDLRLLLDGAGRQPVEHAIRLIERAIALNPVEARYRVTLAVQLLPIGRRREAHECVTALGAEAIGALNCRCCLEKFLRLTIERGDAELASLLAGQLAQIAAAGAARRGRDDPAR